MNIEENTLFSPSSSSDVVANNLSTPSSSSTNVPPISHKRKAGRKKFRETRHPIYSGVRRKNGKKWVCEICEPIKKSRIWLGTFSSPEMAARAHDVAVLALRGKMTKLNFSDSTRVLPRAKLSSARDIQMAILEATRAFQSSSTSSPFNSSRNTNLRPFLISLSSREILGSTELATCAITGSDKGLDSSRELFLDEEAFFNMPGLLNSMAEVLILTPPALKRGFNWDDTGCDMDMTLWRD